jgi:hypothetical protein
MLVLVDEVSTRLMLVLLSASALALVELSSTLVNVTSSTLASDALLASDTDDDTSAAAEAATDPELESSRAPSPDAHATPTRRTAAATAVNTPSIFLNI